MPDTTAPTDDRLETRKGPRYVYVQRPRCPDCGGVKLLAYRTSKNGDGSLTRYVRCADCQARVILIVE